LRHIKSQFSLLGRAYYFNDYLLLLVECLCTSANDFLTLLVSCRISIIFLLLLVFGFFRHTEGAKYVVGIIYFVSSALIVKFFFIGVWLIYGMTSQINFSELFVIVTSSRYARKISLQFHLVHFLLYVYFFFKMAICTTSFIGV